MYTFICFDRIAWSTHTIHNSHVKKSAANRYGTGSAKCTLYVTQLCEWNACGPGSICDKSNSQSSQFSGSCGLGACGRCKPVSMSKPTLSASLRAARIMVPPYTKVNRYYSKQSSGSFDRHSPPPPVRHQNDDAGSRALLHSCSSFLRSL